MVCRCACRNCPHASSTASPCCWYRDFHDSCCCKGGRERHSKRRTNTILVGQTGRGYRELSNSCLSLISRLQNPDVVKSQSKELNNSLDSMDHGNVLKASLSNSRSCSVPEFKSPSDTTWSRIATQRADSESPTSRSRKVVLAKRTSSCQDAVSSARGKLMIHSVITSAAWKRKYLYSHQLEHSPR